MSGLPTTLHFLRPDWLWALLLLPLLWWGWWSRQRDSDAWRDVVDAHLLRYLLRDGMGTSMRGLPWAGMLAYALAVVALAGPAWRQVEVPLWQSRAPLVVALDLSSATLAQDLPPSRLLQARAKIATLLRERAGGEVALVAYAGDAFTVSPLTDDADNVALFLDALSPDVMPVDGSRADRAISLAQDLLGQAGFASGDIVVIGDHADAGALSAASAAVRAGYRVSALGLGTVAGGPYPDRDGTIRKARLDPASLRALAAAGGGRYAAMATDDGDLRALGLLDPGGAGSSTVRGETARSWRDDGYWLLLPLMLLALPMFRRGGAATALVLCLALPLAPSAHASARDWWSRPDQQAHARMQQGASAYQQGDFAHAQRLWRGLPGADAAYNEGNALARAGRYREAIAAYDRALRLHPGMADAIANKRAVEAAARRKPPPGQGNRPGQDAGKGGQDTGNSGQQQGQRQSQGGEGGGGQPAQQGRQPPAPEPRDGTGKDRQPGPGQAPRPPDAEAQRAADEAQRERMRRALAQARRRGGDTEAAGKQQAGETEAQREQRQAVEAWLRRVPDDPGGLLRRKFMLEYQRRRQQGGS